LTLFQDARPQPGFDGPAEGGKRLKFVQERRVVDAIEATPQVSIKHIFGLLANRSEDSLDCVMGRTPRSEAIAVGLEPRFPFGFESQLGESLCGAIM
jgi:hypothetical protein